MLNPAYAQSAAPSGSFLHGIFPLILVFFVFYFLLIRPQQKKQKEHKILLDAIKRGDEILTSGGIIAKVTKAEGEKLNVDIAPNVNVVVYRSTVADVLNKK